MQAKGKLVAPTVETNNRSKSRTIFINVHRKFNCVNLNMQYNEMDPIASLAWQSCTHNKWHQHIYKKLQQTICNLTNLVPHKKVKQSC